MLKAYAIGFFAAVMAVGLAAAIWLVMQPEPKPALVWGTTTYTSKEQFNGYLRSRGLSYKTWVARNPGAAPWEPTRLALSKGATDTAKRDGRATRQVVEDWAAGLPMMPLAAFAAIGATLVLLRRRPFTSSGVAFARPRARALSSHVTRYRLRRHPEGNRRAIKLVPTMMWLRNVSVSDITFSLLGVATLVLFVIFVALLVSL